MRRRAVWLLALLPIVAPLSAFALANLRADPKSVAFDARCVRTSAGAQTVTITNGGSPEAIDVTVSISPASKASLFPLSGVTSKPTLDPNEQFSFGVGFVPEVAGRASANAVVSYRAVQPSPSPTPSKSKSPGPEPDPEEEPQPVSSKTTIPVSGSGIDRFVDVSPKAINFGSARVGREAQPKTVTIYDDGDSPLTVTSISITGRHPRDFTVSNKGPATVRDGRPLTVSLGFKPSKAGARAAKLRVQTDACENPTVEVDLGGVGVEPDIVALPTEVEFGERQLGKGARKTLQLQNAGQFALKVSSVRLTGRESERFKIMDAPKLPKTLRSGQVLNLRLEFTPEIAIPVEAVLEVKSNDPDTKLLKVPLTGLGVIHSPTPSPTPTPEILPTVEPPDDGFAFPIGKYVAELAVSGAVFGFFVLLILVRRVKGIPE